MGALLNIVLVIQMLAAVAMIALVLLQQGKGADMGAAFGSGNSGSLFGASGGANFMSRTTGILAAVFFVCTLTLAYFGNLKVAPTGSVLESAVPTSSIPTSSAPASSVPAPAASAASAPATPATGAAQIPTK
jgi:preprotein translocase subunit SecG